MTIRLAYLCGEYPRATDTFIRREVAGLREAGFHMETISVRRPAAAEQGTSEQESERARTHYLLPCSPVRLILDHAALLARSPLRYLRAFRTALTVRSPGLRALLYQMFYFAEAGMVARHMRRRRLAHLHNHAPDASGYVTMLAAELGGLTYSMTIHGFGILSEPRRWNVTEKLERSLFTICVSHHARSQAMLWTDTSAWDQYHIVRCGVDPEEFDRRVHRGLGKRLLFVGRFDRVKGLPILIDALELLKADHPEVHLDLVGDGPERPAIEDMVSRKGLRPHVTFHGYLSSAEVRERHAQADVMVLSSFSEGIPVVLIEAMASGLPVVAPRITGIPELVEDGVNGILVTPGDSRSLAAGVDCCLRDAALRNKFGAAARSTVERRFNLKKEIQSLQHIFQARLVERIHPAELGERESIAPCASNVCPPVTAANAP